MRYKAVIFGYCKKHKAPIHGHCCPTCWILWTHCGIKKGVPEAHRCPGCGAKQYKKVRRAP